MCVLGLITFSYGLAPAADKDVVVTNTSSNPVPVTGNVGITGTPNVSVTNTPTVNVGNTPTVNAQQDGPWDVGIPGLTNRMTTSSRAVILAGETHTDVSLVAPTCLAGTNFLVTDVYVGPEVLIGATSIDVVQLQNWAISVPVYQYSAGGAVAVPLTALGNGPQAVSASIPAGQRILGSSLPATIIILGGGTASARFEFNVHLTGFCGIGFTK